MEKIIFDYVRVSYPLLVQTSYPFYLFLGVGQLLCLSFYVLKITQRFI